jgi:capping protein alpha
MSDGPTAEQKLNIATYFIMSSPTGELNDVVKDVTKLVSDSNTLNDEALTKIMKEYNHEQMAWAPDPTGQPAMASAFALQSDGKYVNPNNNQNFTFDHKTQKISAAEAGAKQGDAGLNKYRAAVQKALDTYVDNAYKAGKVCAVAYAEAPNRITVCISAKNIHLGNFWTGGWRSCYGVDVKQGSADLKGTVKLGVHYFEDGNVQLHASFDQQTKVNISAKEEETGTAIVNAISKIENEFHSRLEEMYINMHTTTFKQMRRVLTLRKEFMQWNVAAHALAQEVTSNKSNV